MHKWILHILMRNSGELVHGYYTGPETTPAEVFKKKIRDNEFATWIQFDGRDGRAVYVKNSELAAMDIYEINE